MAVLRPTQQPPLGFLSAQLANAAAVSTGLRISSTKESLLSMQTRARTKCSETSRTLAQKVRKSRTWGFPTKLTLCAGDGKSDDTTAIQKAISDGGRCAPVGEQFCNSSTTTPAIVYFPAGTYVVSTSIINYYYTQIMGDPLCMPVLKAAANWTGGFGMIDGDAYTEKGLAWIGVNIFFRQIRNIVLDMTSVPPNVTMTGIHWPTAQVTSITNVVFYMSDAPGTQHQGLFGEEGESSCTRLHL